MNKYFSDDKEILGLFGEEKFLESRNIYKMENFTSCIDESDNEPDIEIAENDYYYLCEAFNDGLTSGFSTTVLLGVSWGILIAAHFFNENSIYFPWVVRSSGIDGFLAAAGGY